MQKSVSQLWCIGGHIAENPICSFIALLPPSIICAVLRFHVTYWIFTLNFLNPFSRLKKSKRLRLTGPWQSSKFTPSKKDRGQLGLGVEIPPRFSFNSKIHEFHVIIHVCWWYYFIRFRPYALCRAHADMRTGDVHTYITHARRERKKNFQAGLTSYFSSLWLWGSSGHRHSRLWRRKGNELVICRGLHLSSRRAERYKFVD